MSESPTRLHYWHPGLIEPTDRTLTADLCIYGGNAGGLAAAIQARRLGLSVVVVEPGWRVGGMTAGGLGWTDAGNRAAVGGLARELYRRIGAHYGEAERWTFEPHVAEQTLQAMIAEVGVAVHFGQFLDHVTMDGLRIVAVRMTSGLSVKARMFIDASYEGDLMAKAGVRFTVGREDNSVYGETLNGVQVLNKHQFEHFVDPYNTPGDPSSGLLPGINAEDPGPNGTGDHRVQAYCFRMCLTDNPDNRMPFPKPAGYDRREYELLARYFATGWRSNLRKFDRVTPDKTDTNNYGAVSTDYIGHSDAWPEADYATRERIFQEHVTYQQGLMWFVSNDPDVPADVREQMSAWGLCRDEFQATGGWPHQIYVREGRRMISDYVVTEHNCQVAVKPEDSVGLASYVMDSHNCQRFVRDGRVLNEGDVQIKPAAPYPVSYRSIVPSVGQCENLFVPWSLSASHIAFGSVRMEPVFMILSQSAATAAALAIDAGVAVQQVDYATLREQLQTQAQILEYVEPTPAPAD